MILFLGVLAGTRLIFIEEEQEKKFNAMSSDALLEIFSRRDLKKYDQSINNEGHIPYFYIRASLSHRLNPAFNRLNSASLSPFCSSDTRFQLFFWPMGSFSEIAGSILYSGHY